MQVITELPGEILERLACCACAFDAMIGVHRSAAAMKSLLRFSIFIKSSCFLDLRTREKVGGLTNVFIVSSSIKGMPNECFSQRRLMRTGKGYVKECLKGNTRSSVPAL